MDNFITLPLAARHLALFHQRELLVLELGDLGLGGLDLVLERLVLVVAARALLFHLEFGDALLQRVDLELEATTVALDLAELLLHFLEDRLGPRRLGLERLPLPRNRVELGLEAEQTAVPVLEHQQLFDGREHWCDATGPLPVASTQAPRNPPASRHFLPSATFRKHPACDRPAAALPPNFKLET